MQVHNKSLLTKSTTKFCFEQGEQKRHFQEFQLEQRNPG